MKNCNLKDAPTPSEKIIDPLTKNELNQLGLLQPTFFDLCLQLAGFNIPETIEHGDFHDNNVLVQWGR